MKEKIKKDPNLRKKGNLILSLFFMLFLPISSYTSLPSDFFTCTPPIEEKKKAFSMEEALEETLKNQWDIFITKMDVEEQRGQYIQTKAPFDPILSLSGSQNFWTNYSKQLGLKYPEGYSFDFPIVGTWTAHDPGGLKAGGYEAEARASLSKLFRIGTQVEIGAEITRDKNPFDILADPYPSYAPFQIPYIRQGAATIYFSIDQPLLKGFIHGKDATSEKSQENEVKAFKLDLIQNVSTNILQTAKAYWDLALAYELLKQQNEAEEQIQDYYDKVVELIQGHQYPAALISEPARSLAEAKANVKLAQRNVLSAEQALIVAVGRKGNRMPFCKGEPILQKLPEITEENLIEKVDVENATHFALENRPDIKAYTYRNIAADYTLKGAENELLPSLSLQLIGRKTNNGYESGATPFFEPFDMVKPKEEIQVGINFSLPLYRSQGKGEVIVARSQKRKIGYQLQKLRADVFSELIQAINEYQDSIVQVRNLKKAVIEARKYKQDLEELFKEGIADLFKLLDAHSQLVDQRIREANVRGEVAKQILQVRYLMGLLVQEEKGLYRLEDIYSLPEEFFLRK